VSSIALIWAANVKGLKPAAKVVLIQLADFHNKDTGLCFPSAHRLAAECEMGRATLFRHMTTLEECGLITRHARGDGEGGRGSNQYELHLDITLGPSAHPTGGSCGSIRVVSQNETGGNVSKKRGKSQIAGAIKEGIRPEDLRQAVQTYATDSAGYTRSKVCFSDNWFQSRRWQAYVEKQVEDREKAKALEADHHARLACWISDRSPMCKHITAPQVTALLASKLVTQAQIQAAGLRA